MVEVKSTVIVVCDVPTGTLSLIEAGVPNTIAPIHVGANLAYYLPAS